MSAFAKFRDGMVGPSIILVAICSVMAIALAMVNEMTAPKIAEVEIAAANETRALVLPEGDAFVELVGIALPEGVTEVYAAENGAGYVISSGAKGYDGTVTYMIGIDPEGNVTGINMFDHNETPGLGTKIAAPSYLAQYLGTTDPSMVDGISGATKTSNSLKNALLQAKEAWQLAVKEG
jgi:Predicted NADH:ubiquinone oxidoreductase, subunit RnfG